MEAERGLGEDLRALRLSRGLSLGVAALHAELSKSTLVGWESGRSRPRGPGFARLLHSLEAKPRLRARLLHAADPQHARIALANTALGAPVDVGAVIRAMRGRRRMTQAELARSVGVTQATVARWESGDMIPSGESLHAAAFALGASPEEAVALACARGEPSGLLPDGPFPGMEALAPHLGPRFARGPLHEVMSLGLEAELWPRAARDARWDPLLAVVMGDRAVQYFLHGRLGEAEETARRGLRLAPTPDVRLAATGCFSALLEVATHQGADPSVLAGKIEGWAPRLPDGQIKGWMHWEQALRLAEMGRPDEAGDLNERMAEMSSQAFYADDNPLENFRLRGLLEIEVRAGRADRAEALLSTSMARAVGPLPDAARFKVRIAHARGETADEATLQAMREEWHPWPEMDNWYTRDKIERIEREQTRLARV